MAYYSVALTPLLQNYFYKFCNIIMYYTYKKQCYSFPPIPQREGTACCKCQSLKKNLVSPAPIAQKGESIGKIVTGILKQIITLAMHGSHDAKFPPSQSSGHLKSLPIFEYVSKKY